MSNLIDTENFANDLKQVIADSIVKTGHSATGRAVNSLEVTMDGNTAIISGTYYIANIESGTPPDPRSRTQDHNSRGLTAPEFALASRLKDGWLQARNIPLDAAYPIAKSIVSSGTLAWQAGGIDVWSSNVEAFIDDNLDKYLEVGDYLRFEI